MSDTISKLRAEMQRAFDEERAKQMEEGEWTDYDRGLADGWVEALGYVLKQIENFEGGSA
jgi:hypothetical protein|tara:strand:- start:565 stop:744 length:180 start_codon:yes stop_codon:yes gene_type:complete